MSKVIKVAPILPEEIKRYQQFENAMGTLMGQYEAARKALYGEMERLLKKYDPGYELNRANQANVYRGQIQDGHLVITLE